MAKEGPIGRRSLDGPADGGPGSWGGRALGVVRAERSGGAAASRADRILVAASGPGRSISVISQDALGRRQLHTYVALQIGTGRLGGVEITDSLSDVERQARQTAWRALFSIGALAMACIGITYLAGLHWVAHPLQSLIEKTKRIGEGDFSHPLQLNQPRRIGTIGRCRESDVREIGESAGTHRFRVNATIGGT